MSDRKRKSKAVVNAEKIEESVLSDLYREKLIKAREFKLVRCSTWELKLGTRSALKNLEKLNLDLKRNTSINELSDTEVVQESESLHIYTEEEEEEEEEPRIEEGDFVNIHDLLFTDYRDYLVKSNGDRVKAEQLADGLWLETLDLIDTYNDLKEELPPDEVSGGMEVVLVAVRDEVNFDDSFFDDRLDPFLQKEPEERFKEKFSCMPWTAIPYSDGASRVRIERKFGLSKYKCVDPWSFIIDPTGIVVSCNGTDIFRDVGVDGFPFSRVEVGLLSSRYEEIAAKKPVSLETLLASRNRKYLITNQGLQVPIWKLEGKVVALYLYEYGCTEDLTEKLNRVYKELTDRGENFEVVLFNLHHTYNVCSISTEDSFNKMFSTMPWLALPFKDPNCRKVARFFDFPQRSGEWVHDPTLVIIGPNGKFVERFGADILMKYGIEAYPFSQEQVVKLNAKRGKKQML